MTSRPAAPESETPETDAVWEEVWRDEFTKSLPDTLYDHARSLERRLSLAQTEIKGHMRAEDELRAENAQFIRDRERANTNERHAASQVIEWSQIATEERHRADQAQVRISELEKDAARLDYLERELEMEQELIRRGKGTDPMYPSLFRRNMPITRAAIDAALKSRA